MVEALCDLVRSMDCYYSKLIEGHNTLPIEIERALPEDYSEDKERRDLQYEARAHIATQRWIDEGGLRRRSATVAAVLGVHERFESAPCSRCAELHARLVSEACTSRPPATN
jgi:hypothetical protein